MTKQNYSWLPHAAQEVLNLMSIVNTMTNLLVVLRGKSDVGWAWATGLHPKVASNWLLELCLWATHWVSNSCGAWAQLLTTLPHIQTKESFFIIGHNLNLTYHLKSYLSATRRHRFRWDYVLWRKCMTCSNTEVQSVPKHGDTHRHTDPSSRQLVWEFSWPMATRGICRVMLCHLPTIMPDYLPQWQQRQPAFLCCSDTHCAIYKHVLPLRWTSFSHMVQTAGSFSKSSSRTLTEKTFAAKRINPETSELLQFLCSCCPVRHVKINAHINPSSLSCSQHDSTPWT